MSDKRALNLKKGVTSPIVLNLAQGGHGTGKQGIWFLLFPDRENTGNFAV